MVAVSLKKTTENSRVWVGMLMTGYSESQALGALEETSPEAFHFRSDVIKWRSANLTTQQILAMRRDFAISFGSCSFAEPIAEMRALGWLG